MDHLNKIREAFSEQANEFGNSTLTLAKADYLNWMVESLPLESEHTVLDVAAGTAHLSRAIAPKVNKVIAFDLTPEMLAEGEKAATEAGITNVEFQVGNAEAMPFEDDSFDLVVSRFAVHHFETPSLQLAEKARVCKPSGFVGVIDMVASEDSDLADAYNHWELVRDPSHTAALSPKDFTELIPNAGLTPVASSSKEIEVDVERWMKLTKVSDDVAKEITQAIEDELSGGKPTGLRPFVKDDRLKFWQTWMIVIGQK